MVNLRSGKERERPTDFVWSSDQPSGFRYAVGNTDKYHAVLRFQGVPLGSDREYDYDTLTSILGGTSSSRLWMEMREKRGLTYGVNASHLCLSDRGSVLISFALEPKNLAKATSVLAAEIRKMRNDGPTAKEIAKSKSHKRGSLALQASDPMNVAYNIVLSETTIRSHRSFEQQMEKYAAVKKSDVARAASIALSQAPLFCVIGPKGGERAAKAAFEASFG